MGGGTGNKGYNKGDDAENMCGATLEPDPRYQDCWSNIFRPGKVLRDVIVGFLVVLAIAVIIAVLFVVCFYLLPAETQETTVKVEEGAFIGKPIEEEHNINVLNEVELTDDTRYDVRPDVVLESIRKKEEHTEDVHHSKDHKEHHHIGPTPAGPESEPEAEPEAEPESEPESEPEPEPETEPEPESEPEPKGTDHEHAHEHGDMSHDHQHTHNEGEVPHEHMHNEGEMPHEHMHNEGVMPHEHIHNADEMSHEHMHNEGEIPHEHMHNEGEVPHEHMHTAGEMPHEHMHNEGEMPHDHMHKEGEMSHEHMHNEGEMPHEQMHNTGEMPHEHMHNEGEMPHEHMHNEGDMHHEHMHTEGEMPHEHRHNEGEVSHEHMHNEGEMIHEHMHNEGEMPHEHMHKEGTISHEHMNTDGEIGHDTMHMEDKMIDEHMHVEDHEHMMNPGNEGSAIFPSSPSNEEVLEVVGAPSLESTPSDLLTEHTILSVASGTGPEGTVTDHSPVTFEENHSLPPLFETLGPQFNGTAAGSDFEVFAEEGTEVPIGGQSDSLIVPDTVIEEVEAPVSLTEEIPTTEEVTAGACRPRQLEMCSDLPYGLTSLPNWANDQNEQELNEGSLPFFRDVIVRSGCSPRARQYACGILEPPCNNDGSIVPPCRTFCRSVATTCQEFIISGYSLSDVFDCERFPDSADPSVCFDMTQAAGDEALVEESGPLPIFPNDQDYPSSPRELSPDQPAVPDYPEVPFVDDTPIEPAYVDVVYPTDEYISATQDYPTERADVASQDPSVLVQLVTGEEMESFSEEPSVLDPLIEARLDTNPEESLITTETSLLEEVGNGFKGVAGDEAPPRVPEVVCDHQNFLCHDGSDCVALTSVCDGIQQCADASDEFNCTQIDISLTAASTDATAEVETQTTIFPEELDTPLTTLPEVIEETTTEALLEDTTVTASGCPELQCLDGTCLALSQLNNGVNDCPDGTDEQDFGSIF